MIGKVFAATAIAAAAIVANAVFPARAQPPAIMALALPAVHGVVAVSGPPWG